MSFTQLALINRLRFVFFHPKLAAHSAPGSATVKQGETPCA
ncbi:hypothetical protein LY39_02159 [Roseinatronobacter bogoriensis subsp. barguzinensis]|nr:hypothetical protein [Rhodobaca bogoriensis DSM 18756]TDW39128.1 hypothetical protein LY39_02159 [Rhodobaca barguzinensis]TDY66448.1 hypothetical protein EV660_11158 [Rhodobaca bogoriensis DSM 18756]